MKVNTEEIKDKYGEYLDMMLLHKKSENGCGVTDTRGTNLL